MSTEIVFKVSDITFRTASNEDIDKCMECIYGAFKDYSCYHIYELNNDERLQQFNRAIMLIQLKDSLVNGHVFVAEHDDEIVGVAQVHDLEYKEPSILQYLFLGALNIFKTGGISNTLGFLHMMERCNARHLEFLKTNPSFNLECIAVSKKCHGQGIGSRLIQECVIPFVKEKNGKYLTLITNEEKNTFFYKKNGFELIGDEEKLNFNNKTLRNWTFVQTL